MPWRAHSHSSRKIRRSAISCPSGLSWSCRMTSARTSLGEVRTRRRSRRAAGPSASARRAASSQNTGARAYQRPGRQVSCRTSSSPASRRNSVKSSRNSTSWCTRVRECRSSPFGSYLSPGRRRATGQARRWRSCSAESANASPMPASVPDRLNTTDAPRAPRPLHAMVTARPPTLPAIISTSPVWMPTRTSAPSSRTCSTIP